MKLFALGMIALLIVLACIAGARATKTVNKALAPLTLEQKLANVK